MKLYHIILFWFRYLFLQRVNCVLNQDFNLTIMHFNSFEARFLPIDKAGKLCHTDDKQATCFGGYARLKQKIKEIRQENPDVLLLNAGDFSLGTILASAHGWKISSHLLNQLPHTAFTLGFHELELGTEDDLGQFVNSLNMPVVCCNINSHTFLREKILKSIIIKVNGKDIGITGYVSSSARLIPSLTRLEFVDEMECIQNEANRLKNKEKVSAVIVLSSGEFPMDLKMAELSSVDIVVGGRSRIFLYSGSYLPSTETPYGKYPLIVSKPDGTPGLVVQAYRFGKYLGYLQVQFSHGRLQSWSGNPILMDEKIPLDSAAVQDLQMWMDDLRPLRLTKIGHTHVYLDGSKETCCRTECGFGNLLTDAMVYMSLNFATDFQWNYVSIAMHDCGGIMESIDGKKNNGSITLEDLYQAIPFRNSIDFIEIKGEYIREVFEHSAEFLHLNISSTSSRFLQVSGVHVTYDICRPPGSRVVEIFVSCNECRFPQYELLKNENYYRIAVPGFIATGGNGYSMLMHKSLSHQRTGLIDVDILQEYLKKRGPVLTAVEGRIVTLGDPSCYRPNLAPASVLFKSLRIIYSIFLGIFINYNN